MLLKKNRVTKDTFNVIMNKGSVIYGSFFVFRYLKQGLPQYAFVVSKKNAKTAVKRNSFRRKGYNIIRFFNLKSYAGIFFFKKEALLCKNEELKKDIDFLLKKAKII